MEQTAVPNSTPSLRQIGHNAIHQQGIPVHSGHCLFDEHGPTHENVFLVKHIDAHGNLDKVYMELHNYGRMQQLEIHAPTYHA